MFAGLGGAGGAAGAGLGGMGAFGGMPGAAASTGPEEEPKVKYASQIAQMKEMGFPDEDTNAQVLKETNGNVQIAVERLLNMLG